jgi:hypothetical protein
VTYCGQPVPEGIRRRVINLSSEGKSPNPILRFYERLSKNPSKRSVDQLFPFIDKMNIPITNDGCFLAYKGVNDDYMDKHSNTISNKPGTTVKLPRNLVSDDPREECHFGLHVGASGYASSFKGYDGRMVICKVDPEHVVCVPYDHNQQKMRVCEYKVIGNYGDQLPDDVMEEEELENLHDKEAVETIVEEIDSTEQLKTGKTKSKEKQHAKVASVKTVRIEKKIDKSAYTKYGRMDAQKLMNESLDDLRKYATYGLEMVGASKVPGGKSALVAKIVKFRK